jgi:hypothetical protein
MECVQGARGARTRDASDILGHSGRVVSGDGEYQWVQERVLMLFDVVVRAGDEGERMVWNMAGMAMSMSFWASFLGFLG